jgi:hypothetical protein
MAEANLPITDISVKLYQIISKIALHLPQHPIHALILYAELVICNNLLQMSIVDDK